MINISLVLIGFMGAGKTTLAAMLTRETRIPSIDTDLLLENQHNLSPGVQTSLADFRAIEAAVIKEVVLGFSGIISLGGGAIERATTRALLVDLPVLWLDPGVDICWQRVKADPTYRPLAQNYDDFVNLYHKRVPLYRECARWHLKSIYPPEQLAKEVLELTYLRA